MTVMKEVSGFLILHFRSSFSRGLTNVVQQLAIHSYSILVPTRALVYFETSLLPSV